MTKRSISSYQIGAALMPAIVLLALLGSRSAVAGVPGSPFGTHFIIAFPDTVWHISPPNIPPLKPQTNIVIYSLDTATVQINGPSFQRKITVMPGASQVLVPPPVITWVTNATLKGSSYDITSDRDIAIYCYYATAYGAEAFRPLPVASWGSEYVVAGLREEILEHIRYKGDEESVGYSKAPGEIVIFASEYTQVHVDYPSTFRERDADLTLDAGDMIVLESHDTNFVYQDISGTRITSTRPVGVISGSTRSLGGGVIDVGVEIVSPMRNSAIEWLPPADAWGKTFAYRQISPHDGTLMRELVRVYATSPGTTNVRDMRDGTVRVLQQGEFIDLASVNVDHSLPVPFQVLTDQPAQAMVISGPFSSPTDPGAIVPYSFNLWGVAMSELVPYQSWITFARFYAPAYPTSLQHYVTIIADTSARVWLDGRELALDRSYPRFPYQQDEIAIAQGDHTIIARGGKASAIAYGTAPGFEDYRPVGTREKDAPSPLMPHPSVYSDRMAVSYAYPVSGVVTSGIDSLVIGLDEGCDSTIALATRPAGGWDLLPLVSAKLEPGSVNARIAVDTIREAGQVTGYRIRFSPIDLKLDASATAVIVNLEGKRWEIPYS
jgi:hypothetical protein